MAIGDLADARAIVAADDAPIRGAAYLAQQSAEKAIKGAIESIGVDPPRIHDLRQLAAAIPPLFDGWSSPPDLTRLTAAIVSARYPDPDDPPFEVDEVDRLISDAAAVIDAVRAHFARLAIGPADLDAI
jgi:HEPN domain-containing protein